MYCYGLFFFWPIGTSWSFQLRMSANQNLNNINNNEVDMSVVPPNTMTAFHHHVALKTRNITNAIQFYSMFGFEVHHKFRAGTRCIVGV